MVRLALRVQLVLRALQGLQVQLAPQVQIPLFQALQALLDPLALKVFRVSLGPLGQQALRASKG